MVKKIHRWFILWFLLGEQYFVLEALYRFIFKHGERAHISMLLVGGLCCLAVGAINQIPKFYNMAIWKQSLIGTLVTLLIEFISGYILNIVMGLHIWDYSQLPGNIMGQVSIPFAFIWLFLMPLAIWAEDTFRYHFWNEGTDYTLKSIYRDFIEGK